MSGETRTSDTATASTARTVNTEPDAIYQEGKVVARAVGVEVRRDNREVHFAEINTSDNLILPEECEFLEYRLMILRIEYASRVDKQAPEKGRVLRGVVAEILGYREQ